MKRSNSQDKPALVIGYSCDVIHIHDIQSLNRDHVTSLMRRPFACMGASPDSGNFLLCVLFFYIYIRKVRMYILDVLMYLYRDGACAAYIHAGIDLKY